MTNHWPSERLGKNIKVSKKRMWEDVLFVLNKRIAQGCECLFMGKREPPCYFCKAEKFAEMEIFDRFNKSS